MDYLGFYDDGKRTGNEFEFESDFELGTEGLMHDAKMFLDKHHYIWLKIESIQSNEIESDEEDPFIPHISEEEVNKYKQKSRFDFLLKLHDQTSAYKLAKDAGLPQRTVLDLCKGTTQYGNAQHSTIMAIAKALGMTAEELDKAIIG